MKSNDFDKWTHLDAGEPEKFTFSNGHTVNLFEISSIHALNQFVGFAKYKFMQEDGTCVFFRGQSKLYDSLLPSAFRPVPPKTKKGKPVKPINSKTQITKRYTKIQEYVEECKSKMLCLKKVNEKIVEPLLQHYGVKTSWLDIVDNLWVALWFAIHESKTICKDSIEYEHVSLCRNVEKVYLLLIKTKIASSKVNGFLEGEKNEVVNLRNSAPSIFLRPHAQHALLIRTKNRQNLQDVDLADNVCAILSFKFEDVKEWLGKGQLLSSENIYPPAMYDEGYRFLLNEAPQIDQEKIPAYGCITRVSYSV